MLTPQIDELMIASILCAVMEVCCRGAASTRPIRCPGGGLHRRPARHAVAADSAPLMSYRGMSLRTGFIRIPMGNYCHSLIYGAITLQRLVLSIVVYQLHWLQRFPGRASPGGTTLTRIVLNAAAGVRASNAIPDSTKCRAAARNVLEI
ncbi:hypothetical protein KCP69_05650 [Salmonella enterica subsp. enterica]|nr:hypothetical protein KCP69_05650 [Salmonella enterica subsp. enterica]